MSFIIMLQKSTEEVSEGRVRELREELLRKLRNGFSRGVGWAVGGPGAQRGKWGEGARCTLSNRAQHAGASVCTESLPGREAVPGRDRAVSCALSTAAFPTTSLGKASLTDEETGLDR